jgi:hypothetical protein
MQPTLYFRKKLATDIKISVAKSEEENGQIIIIILKISIKGTVKIAKIILYDKTFLLNNLI